MKSVEIDRRTFLKNSSLTVAGLIAAGLSDPAKAFHHKTNKPHIIYIMSDQHRGDCMGCIGNKVAITPNMDALAKEGVCFKNAYTASPSCTPARAGLLTGLSPWHHGMLGYGRVGLNYKYELPRMIRNAGYYTFGIGKMHWFPQKTLHGFHGTLVDESSRVETEDFVSDYRRWFKKVAPDKSYDPPKPTNWNSNKAAIYENEEKLHPTHWTGQTAVDLINNYDREEPLLLKVSFARPHSPYDPPKRFHDLYKTEDMPAPFIGNWCDKFADMKDVPNKWGPAFGDFSVEFAKKARHAYYANVTFIDEQVGEIISALKQKGMYDNALIFYTADHGDMLGDHHHWRKTYAYEGSAKIPMLMKWPKNIKTKVKRGSNLPQPVELRDFLPTFLDITGQKIPDDMDGMSLLKLVKNKNTNWRQYIDSEHSTCYHSDNYWCALTDGKIKYIYFFPTGEHQLFNLEKDPGEINNLADELRHKETLELWKTRMVEHLSERGPDWVKDNRLQIRKKGQLYGPNFPKKNITPHSQQPKQI